MVDLGSGSGILARLVTDAGFDVLGFDISDDMVRLASAHAPRPGSSEAPLLDADIPPCVAVTAVGEILNYAFDPRTDLDRLAGVLPAGAGRRSRRAGSSSSTSPAPAGPVPPVAGRRSSRPTVDHPVGRRGGRGPDGPSLVRQLTLVTADGAHHDETHVLRLYRPDDVEALLAAAGFARRPPPQPLPRLRVSARPHRVPGPGMTDDRDRRRPAALPVGRRPARVPPLPRRGVGPPGRRRPPALREAVPGGLPGRPVVAHHPPQAGGLPAGLRRLRPGHRRRLRARRRRPAAGRRRHRPPPGQDRGHHRQRPGHARGPGQDGVAGRAGVAVRAGPPGPPPTAMADLPATTPESVALSRELRRRGFRFVGPDHGLRGHAVPRPGRRPPGRLPRPGRGGGGAGRLLRP